MRADSPAATARRVGRPLPPLRSARPDLDRAVCEVVDAALDPDPAYRPPLAELREVLRDAEPELGDRGGLVEAETIERFGLTAARPRTARTRILGGSRSPPLDEVARQPLARAAVARAGAGAAAGALAAGALAGLAPSPPFSIAVAAGAVAVAVALLPRAGWIAAAIALCAWLASPDAGREGTAIVLAVALAPVPLLLPRSGLLWSAPALAPLLGVAALSPLFVAVASLCSTAWRRVGLAAAGFLWLAIGATLRDRDLSFGAGAPAPPRAGWEGSVVDAVEGALIPLASSLEPLPPLLWIAGALALAPLTRALARGRGGRRAALP